MSIEDPTYADTETSRMYPSVMSWCGDTVSVGSFLSSATIWTDSSFQGLLAALTPSSGIIFFTSNKMRTSYLRFRFALCIPRAALILACVLSFTCLRSVRQLPSLRSTSTCLVNPMRLASLLQFLRDNCRCASRFPLCTGSSPLQHQHPSFYAPWLPPQRQYLSASSLPG